MASPKLEVLFLYDINTGLPLTGYHVSMSFETYKNDQGTNISQPAITEIGGGAYKFTPTFADPERGIVYILHVSGSQSNPKRFSRYMRPEDWNDDSNINVSASVDFTKKFLTNRHKIDTTTNQMTHYDNDGTTALKTFDLKDQNAAATSTNVFEKVPT